MSPVVVVLVGTVVARVCQRRRVYAVSTLATHKRMQDTQGKRYHVEQPSSGLTPFVPATTGSVIEYPTWLGAENARERRIACTKGGLTQYRTKRKRSRRTAPPKCLTEVTKEEVARFFKEEGGGGDEVSVSPLVHSLEEKTQIKAGQSQYAKVTEVNPQNRSVLDGLGKGCVEMHGVPLCKELRAELKGMLASLELRHVSDPLLPPQTRVVRPSRRSDTPDTPGSPDPAIILESATLSPSRPHRKKKRPSCFYRPRLSYSPSMSEVSTGSPATERRESRAPRKPFKKPEGLPLFEPPQQEGGEKVELVPGVVMSQGAWMMFTCKAHKWKQEIVRQRERAAYMATLDENELWWNRREVAERWGVWKLNVSWRGWMRRRYLRKCWVAWASFVQAVLDSKVAAMVNLTAVIAYLTQHKTFVVWRRFTQVEKMAALPPITLFDAVPCIPQWDVFFVGYRKERSMNIAMSQFVMKNRTRKCFFALKNYKLVKQHKKNNLEIANRIKEEKGVKIVFAAFRTMYKIFIMRRSTALFSQSLLAKGFGMWQHVFKKRIILRVHEEHTKRRVIHNTKVRALATWVQRKRMESQLKVLLTLRCILHKEKMIFFVAAIQSSINFILIKCFRAWAHSAVAHGKFVLFVTTTVREGTQGILRRAFLAWQRHSNFEPLAAPIDWVDIDKIKSSIMTSTTLHPVGTTIRDFFAQKRELQMQKERDNGASSALPYCPASGYGFLFGNWLGGSNPFVTQHLLYRLVLNSIVAKCMAYRSQVLAKVSLFDEKPNYSLTMAPHLDRHRVVECSEREARMRLLLCSRQHRLRSKVEEGAQKVEALLPQIQQLAPHFCRSVVGDDKQQHWEINCRAFVAYLHAEIIKNAAVVALARYRDPLLAQPKMNKIVGILSGRDSHMKKARALAVVHKCIVRARRGRVVNLQDVSCLRLAPGVKKDTVTPTVPSPADLGVSPSLLLTAVWALHKENFDTTRVMHGEIADTAFKTPAFLYQLLNPDAKQPHPF